MYVGRMIIGLIIGAVVGAVVTGMGGVIFFAAVAGAVIGQLLGRLGRLEERVRILELPPLKFSRTEPEQQSPRESEQTLPEAHPWFEAEETDAPEQTVPDPAAVTDPDVAGTVGDTGETPPPWDSVADQRTPSLSQKLQPLLKTVTTWFTTGNVPVKVGVIISFFGVAFLLKYAIDRELLLIPLELRLLAVAAAGLAMIVIGWRLRSRVEVYALSLQGGGLGVLFLTIFSALRIWQLLPAPLAFFLLVALTFFTGALAVLQNARSLAVLGIVGGFLAPVLTSTGQGSHVVLFSYYLLINTAILGISWFRAWRELNLVGFVFTFLIGSFWGYQYYKPALFASTEPFLILYFLFYQAIAILYAQRQPPERLGIVDGTLVFGTPAIVFFLQAELMKGSEYGLAISAAVVAIFYVLLATWLFRRKGDYLRLLTESFMALAVAFATITIPLALDARWTSAAWALEGAALVWVGTRQRRYLAGLAGVGLIFLSGLSFMEYGWKFRAGIPVLNGNVLGGVLISLSALFASRLLEHFEERIYPRFLRVLSILLFLWGILWWLGTGFFEIVEWRTSFNESHLILVFWSLSAVLAVWLGRSRQWSRMRRTSFIFLPLLLLPALFTWITDQHVLFSLGWLAWPMAWVAQGLVLKTMDEFEDRLAGSWHFCSLMLLGIVLAIDAYWWIDQIASVAWAGAVATAVPGIMALLVWRFRTAIPWPVQAHPSVYLFASILLVVIQVICLAFLSISNPGNSDPWPYLPVLNPFDLGMLFALVTSMLSLSVIQREAAGDEFSFKRLTAYRSMLIAAFFVMTTFALVRAVHQYTGVSWNSNSLFKSDIVQTSLSIYWGLLGFTGMIWGARSARRYIWLTGAAFMALVVIKLFLVDLGNTGTVERIVSFIGIGLLLLVVGYFAPAPPKQAREDESRDGPDPHNGVARNGSES